MASKKRASKKKATKKVVTKAATKKRATKKSTTRTATKKRAKKAGDAKKRRATPKGGRLGTLKRKAKKEGWDGWIVSAADERWMLNGGAFEIGRAWHVCQFFETYLCLSKGRWGGKPFMLLPWEQQVLGSIFGWVGPEGERHDGGRLRRYRRAKIWIPKKNGKSALASGVGLYLTIGDGEPGAEVYSAATQKSQAAIVHDEAINMVKVSPQLARRLRINKTTKTISDDATASKYEVLSSESVGAEGINAHGIIRDEMHVWSDRVFYDSLEYAYAARDQPLDFVISTAGEYDKTSIGWGEYQLSMHVRDGVVEDDRCYVFICEAPRDADIEDPKAHEIANPSYGEIITPEQIAEDAKTAAAVPSKRNAFKRYRLNIWTYGIDSFVDMDRWDSADADVEPRATRADRRRKLRRQRCFGGLDLGSNNDLTSLLLQFTRRGGGYWWLPFFWIPEDSLKDREADHKVPYGLWAENGYMIKTPGDVTDYDQVESDILQLSKEFGITSLGVDRAFQGDQLIGNLHREGLPVAACGMGTLSMAAPMKEFERRYLAGEIHHLQNPVMRWNATGLAVDEDKAGNLCPNKKKSRTKIDGVVAGLMAIRMEMAVTKDYSFYEDNELEFM